MHKLNQLLDAHLPRMRAEWQRWLAGYQADAISPARRRTLKSISALCIAISGGYLLLGERPDSSTVIPNPLQQNLPLEDFPIEESDSALTETTEPATDSVDPIQADDESIRDYLYKMRNFNTPHDQDHLLSDTERALLQQTVTRLRRTQRFVGHANFNLLSFDDLCYYARNYAAIGAFTRAEQELMEQFFYIDARELGFYGDKILDRLTLPIKENDTIKVAGSGNYLFRGKPQSLFNKIKKESGSDDVILTSGVRGIVKQMHLFMEKALNANGNLSLASRSLAPPGYSYHGISDFDVGQRGLGYNNFTAVFAQSDVYKRLHAQGYLTMRYPLDNMLGVRYEPWHVKVS